jgi:hypothetical protein
MATMGTFAFSLAAFVSLAVQLIFIGYNDETFTPYYMLNHILNPKSCGLKGGIARTTFVKFSNHYDIHGDWDRNTSYWYEYFERKYWFPIGRYNSKFYLFKRATLLNVYHKGNLKYYLDFDDNPSMATKEFFKYKLKGTYHKVSDMDVIVVK